MSNITPANAVESALIQGDLSKLSTDQRLNYFKSVCESVGLNPLTKPFEFIQLNGKLVLYAKRDATDQLRKVHKVSITITSREKFDDIYVVTARAKDKDGREDESTGAVNIAGLKGDSLANACMKAETKAKRRVTLSICGLGVLDESELETVKDQITQEIKNPLKELRAEKDNVKNNLGEYEITFGKYKGQKLKDVDMFELDNYRKWVIQSAQEQGKEIKNGVKTFVDASEAYLCSLEVQEPEIFPEGA